MENTPEAAGAAPAPQTEATPTNSNPEPAQAPAAPDMHGFTSEQLADMQKFFQANGGYDKVKSRISNPTPAPAEEQKPVEPARPVEPEEPPYVPPEGSIRPDEFLAQQYFGALSREEKYAAISKEIESGAVLKDMAAFNIRPLNRDGSINDTMVRRFLDMKAQTVVAHQSSATPEASNAPTVDYVPVDGDIKDMRQAMAVLQQDSMLKRSGQAGHPAAEAAEKFMREQLNPSAKK
jgi:hypothetical protein